MKAWIDDPAAVRRAHVTASLRESGVASVGRWCAGHRGHRGHRSEWTPTVGDGEWANGVSWTGSTRGAGTTTRGALDAPPASVRAHRPVQYAE